MNNKEYNNFNWETYVNNYDDLKKVGINNKELAWKHWLKIGKKESRTYNYIFKWDIYINNYDDLRKAGINNKILAWKHWIKYGKKESRICNYNIKEIDNNSKQINNNTKEIDNNYYKKLDLFCNEYNVNKNDVYNNSKIEFRYFCYRYIDYIRNIELPKITQLNNNEAVLIEYRCFPHLEFLIRNTINKLGEGWSHTIICGNLNYDFIVNMCNKISLEIKIIKTNYDNLDQGSYSNFLTTSEFWNMFYGEKILIYQEDSCIFRKKINNFLQWDYIGAPWPYLQNDNINGVGNGGFSLRSKSCMLKVIETISLENTVFNSSTINYMNSTGLKFGPEDVYFSLNMLKYNIGKVADRDNASLFSTESVYNKKSLGGHNFWISYKNWKELMYKKVVKQFNANYDKNGLEHRGGWKSILENLETNDIFNNNSKIQLLDIVEQHFLWKDNYRCNDKWIGIIHCTQYTPKYLNIINIKFLFDNKNFIKSLDNCLFIISLTNYVADYLKNEFNKINKNIKIYVLKHPVVSDDIIYFDYNKYIENSNKYIVQIGQQLRKMSSIYYLDINNYKKLWLTGTKNFNTCINILNKEISEYNLPQIDNSLVELKYTKTFKEYDEILSINIVFIELFDASANNTVLECIVRNTPIIVNKLPGVIEYLGEDYPLYFNKLSEVNNLISDENILKAHEYLKNMNKEDLTIDYFTKKIFNLVENNL